jgi:hypothetical protein
MKKELVILLCLMVLTACAINAPLAIPYVKQSGPSCVPSQMTMALQYYFPERDYTLAQIDSMIGREEDKWTWFSQALPILTQEGLDAQYYSTTPYYQLTPEYILEYYGQDDGKLINGVTDWDQLHKSIDFLKTTNKYANLQLPWSEVEKAVNKDTVVLMIIDYNTLMGKPGLYSGHGVTITQITPTHVVFHNSNIGPNQVVEKQKFINAWNAPGTDNDIIIITGKTK